MGFWVFMIVMSMILPVIMIGFGRWFQSHSPKKINSIYGYRTKMSMKNMDTWRFAHMYFGKCWYRVGCYLLPVSIIPMLIVCRQSEGVVGCVGSVLMVVQCMMLILPIVWTEGELRKRFDEDGNCKS